MNDYFVFFKQKTAYEMRISDWSSDVCSSDLPGRAALRDPPAARSGARGADHRAGGLGPGCRASAGADPPRRETVQHPADAVELRLPDRLRVDRKTVV